MRLAIFWGRSNGSLLVTTKEAAAATTMILIPWRIKVIEGSPTKEASCSNVYWTLYPIKGSHVDIKENRVVIGIAIRRINSFKPLRKLNITNAFPTLVHHEAHAFSQCLGVVYVVVTVKVKNERSIRRNSRSSNQCIHCSGLLVVIITRSLFARNINQYRKANVHFR
jgi:hypothetical protein